MGYKPTYIGEKTNQVEAQYRTPICTFIKCTVHLRARKIEKLKSKKPFWGGWWVKGAWSGKVPEWAWMVWGGKFCLPWGPGLVLSPGGSSSDVPASQSRCLQGPPTWFESCLRLKCSPAISMLLGILQVGAVLTIHLVNPKQKRFLY
jgi:hypothetical protein